MRESHKIRPEHTTPRAWRHQAPRAQKGHALLLLGHLVIPAAKLRTLSLPNKTTDCSTVCNTRPGRSPGGFSAPTSPCVVPNTARKFAFPWTFLPSHTVLGTCLPSACERASEPLHWLCLLSSPAFHLDGAQTPMSRPVALLQRGTNLLQSLQPARIRVPLRDVQVSHHDVGGHPGPAFATDLGDSTLHDMTSPAERTHLAACCSVMAKDVQWTATRAETAGEGQWHSGAAAANPERLRMTLSPGNVVKGTDAIGPLWDRTDACSDGDNSGHTTYSL